MLVKPYKAPIMGPPLWRETRRDTLFTTLVSNGTTLGAPYRVLISLTKTVVAEAASEEEAARDWDEAHRVALRARQTPQDAPEREAEALQDGDDEMFSFINRAADDTSKKRSDSVDSIFAFTVSPPPEPSRSPNPSADLSSAPTSPNLRRTRKDSGAPPRPRREWSHPPSPVPQPDAPRAAESVEETAKRKADEVLCEGVAQLGCCSKHPLKSGVKWKDHYFVVKQHCVFIFDRNDKEKMFALAPPELSTFRLEVIATKAGETAVSSNLANSGLIGYRFDLFNGLENVCLATENIFDYDEWVEVFRSCAKRTPEQIRELRKQGWVITTHTALGKWERRWAQLTDGVLELWNRSEYGHFPLKNSRIEPQGLEIVVQNQSDASSYIRFRVDVPSWNRWIQALRTGIELAQSEAELESREEVEIKARVEEILAQEIADRARPRGSSAGRAQRPDTDEILVSPTLSPRRKFLILSIDGGGVRGIMPSVILERLYRTFPDLIDRTDLLAGTSYGGLFAMCLAFGHDPKFSRAVLEATAKMVFKPAGGALSTINASKFDNRNLLSVARRILGDRKLREASKRIVVPAFLLDNRMPVGLRSCEVRYMHNLDAAPGEEDCANVLAADVVMRTTAAPTFFPSFQGFVDGGMFAQDPSNVALEFALSPHRGIEACLEDVCLLSIGTGKVMRYYEDATDNGHDWGYMQWVPKLLTIFWDAMVLKSEASCRELLGSRYFKVCLQIQLPVY
eukprot:m51a1_g1650 putative patatin family protein (738) ;mRNA; f:343511-346434